MSRGTPGCCFAGEEQNAALCYAEQPELALVVWLGNLHHGLIPVFGSAVGHARISSGLQLQSQSGIHYSTALKGGHET